MLYAPAFSVLGILTRAGSGARYRLCIRPLASTSDRSLVNIVVFGRMCIQFRATTLSRCAVCWFHRPRCGGEGPYEYAVSKSAFWDSVATIASRSANWSLEVDHYGEPCELRDVCNSEVIYYTPDYSWAKARAARLADQARAKVAPRAAVRKSTRRRVSRRPIVLDPMGTPAAFAFGGATCPGV